MSLTYFTQPRRDAADEQHRQTLLAQLAAEPSIAAMIDYAATSPAIVCDEGYWDDMESACSDGERQEQSRAAAVIRCALEALGIDPPAGLATCPDCYGTDGDHASQCALPCIAVKFVAEGVQVTARTKKEAERFANEDTGELASKWNYRLADVAPAGEHEGAGEDLGAVEIEIGDGTRSGETWTFAPTFRVVVKEPDDPAAIVAALAMLGVADPAAVAAPMIAEWEKRA